MRTAWLVLLSMRPRQWTKNLVVLAPFIFASLLSQGSAVIAALQVLAAFCFASGAAYLVNDIVDVPGDRLNPQRSHRPVASGALSSGVALVAAGVAVVVGIALAWVASPASAAWLVGFLLLQAGYSLALKRYAYVDALAISACFVVRVQSGSYAAIGTTASLGMLGSAAALALFLALAKRRWELVVAGEDVHRHRAASKGYSPRALDRLLWAVAGLTVGAYLAWMLGMAAQGGNPLLPASTLFVALGLTRYLWLVFRRMDGGTPENTLITDVPLIADLVLWAVVLYVGLYINP